MALRYVQKCELSYFVIVIVIYLLPLHILILLRIGSEERMVFLGGHPAKYWPPTNVSASSGSYYSGPSWYLGHFLPVVAADIVGHSIPAMPHRAF